MVVKIGAKRAFNGEQRKARMSCEPYWLSLEAQNQADMFSTTERQGKEKDCKQKEDFQLEVLDYTNYMEGRGNTLFSLFIYLFFKTDEGGEKKRLKTVNHTIIFKSSSFDKNFSRCVRYEQGESSFCSHGFRKHY